jgi:hypothetical protein
VPVTIGENQSNTIGEFKLIIWRDIHGFEGPIKVSFGNYTYPIMQDFLRASESQGIPTTDDLEDLVTGQ